MFELSTRFSEPHIPDAGTSEEAKLEKYKLIFLELTQGEHAVFSTSPGSG